MIMIYDDGQRVWIRIIKRANQVHMIKNRKNCKISGYRMSNKLNNLFKFLVLSLSSRLTNYEASLGPVTQHHAIAPVVSINECLPLIELLKLSRACEKSSSKSCQSQPKHIQADCRVWKLQSKIFQKIRQFSETRESTRKLSQKHRPDSCT